ncbi:MAG: phosphoglucosamine mutase [Blastocatellales bacterium]
MGKLFGTDGIRGPAGEYPLNSETIERIGYLLAKELSRRLGRVPKIVTGRDTRVSGEWIEAAAHRGISAADGSITSAGIITTPGVAFVTRELGADAGVVISASHNPFIDNGIKIFAPDGRKLDEGMEDRIESMLLGEKVDYPDFTEVEVRSDPALRERYIEYLVDEVGTGLEMGGMKMVLDCANGAASGYAPQVFERLGCRCTIINAAPDGKNINLDCGSLHPEKLQMVVSENRAVAGFAFDGDADRLMMIGPDERLIDGDQILYIMAGYLKMKKTLAGDRVVATVMSNLGLEKGLAELGIDLYRASVGDKYVLDELLKGGGSLGGEQSGHIIFPEISLAGDGMITAIEILRVMRETGRSLDQLLEGFTSYPQVIINVRVAAKPPIESLPQVASVIRQVEDDLDGQGRVLVRYSGTENKARVMIEGRDGESVQRFAELIADSIRAEIGSRE